MSTNNLKRGKQKLKSTKKGRRGDEAQLGARDGEGKLGEGREQEEQERDDMHEKSPRVQADGLAMPPGLASSTVSYGEQRYSHGHWADIHGCVEGLVPRLALIGFSSRLSPASIAPFRTGLVQNLHYHDPIRELQQLV